MRPSVSETYSPSALELHVNISSSAPSVNFCFEGLFKNVFIWVCLCHACRILGWKPRLGIP